MSDESVKVACPKCSSKLNVREELREKTIGCPNCQHKFRLNFASSESNVNSLIQTQIEPLENLDRSSSTPESDSQAKSPRQASESTSANTSSTRPLGSNSSLSGSYSGSISNSQIPVQTDWGKEHYTQSRQFKKDHAGLSRSQIYRLTKRRYESLSQSDEILQSTGIFLCIMAVLTATLPLFDLKFVDFGSAGSIPAMLSIATAIIGMLMIVIAQRKNPIMALGLGIGMLLMFVISYVAIYDFVKDKNPFRDYQNEVAQAPKEALADPPAVAPEKNVEIVEGGREQIPAAPDRIEHGAGVASLRAGGGQPLPNNGGFRKLRGSRQPLRPEEVEVPEDFDPDADRFVSDNPDDRIPKNSLIEETVKSPEQIARERELEDRERRKKFLINRRLEKMSTESFYKGKPSTDEFSSKFEVAAIAGEVATAGIAYLTDAPVTGFDYVERGGVIIKKLVPITGDPQFRTTISSPDNGQLRGLVCHFHFDQLSGIQALYSQPRDDSLYQGKWAGKPTPLGKAGFQITSGKRPVYGFVLFTNDDSIVGVGLVVKKKT